MRADGIYSSGTAISISAYTYNLKALPVVLYIAQLALPPKDICKIEFSALHKVTHMATNALTLGDFLSLSVAGGPEFKSLSVSMYATLYSAARKTIVSWPEWCRQVKLAASEFLNASRLSQGLFFPDCWDSTPYACNLQEAYSKYPHFPFLTPGINNAIQEIREAPSNDTQSLQTITYKNLLASAFRLNVVNETIFKRVRTIFQPYDISETGIDINSALSICIGLQKHDAMRILKTWCNSWATSHRLHETIRFP